MTVLHMDCIEGMRAFPDHSFDSIVTDGPYGIRFMGKAWDGADIEAKAADRRRLASQAPGAGPNGGHKSMAAEAGKYDLSPRGMQAFQDFSTEWASEALRVLKPGGYLLSFSSPRTYHRMTCGIENAGFEIRDQIMWLFGSGFPKSFNLHDDREGWGTALKPAHEPICVARKPIVGTIAENVVAHGTGAINIDGCRVDGPGGVKWETSRGGIWRTGSTESAQLIDNPKGRWPANFIHDGSDEITMSFMSSTGGGSESIARFFYCAKASKADRDEGLENFADQVFAASNQAQAELKRGNLHVGGIGINTAKLRKNIHPTVKPTKLMRWLVRLVTPPGGIVLDPFAGSGSTGKAAKLEGFGFIGFERELNYAQIANARIDATVTDRYDTETLKV